MTPNFSRRLAMRGVDTKQGSMLSLMGPERRVPTEHPLRKIKALADAALAELSKDFDAMYSAVGRPSIPPEKLLKATLLMALYTIRSERLFCEQLDYNLLFRWFLDMNMDEPSFDHSTLSANRARLLGQDVARKFFGETVSQGRDLGLMSDEHFTVDGTLIDAWASLKSFRPKNEGKKPPPDDPGNPTVDFRGEKRSNETHQSTTDPEALLAKKGKGKEAKLSFSANALMENRNGLLVDFRVTKARGYSERETALVALDEELAGNRRVTVAGDKGYDTAGFVQQCREMNVTPHVAQNLRAPGGSAIDERTTRHPGYTISQVFRKRIEEIFGWMKTIGGFRRTRFKGTTRTQQAAYFVAAAYNLLRIARLVAA
jgi:transposase